jgi:predicted ATPase
MSSSTEGASVFARHVGEVLAHLCDPVFLQSHPLSQLLCRDDPRVLPSRAGQVLHHRLLDAIAALRPASKTRGTSPLWRRYQLLSLRYVEALDPAVVQSQLGISKSQYYRDHAKALEALASALAELWRQQSRNSETGAAVNAEQVTTSAVTPGDASSVTPAHNLPAQLLSFIGRQPEIAAVRGCLRRQEVRLLTLVGPGGVGKTRLALEVAHGLVDDFSQGVQFVSLATLSDSALVATAIAQVLGLRQGGGQSIDALVGEYLRERDMLLVLDNFEHLLDASSLVANLLAGSTQLKVLITSRVPLHLSAEHQFPVPPLALPEPNAAVTAAQVEDAGAVQLFVSRVRLVRPDFVLTDEPAHAVAEICRRLDGLPLAIELAAARLKLFSPRDLLARLDRRLPLLVGGPRDAPSRQRTLRDAIAWSYELLSPQEQGVFRRLGVFAGGCTLDSVGAVACDVDDTDRDAMLDRLTTLVQHSLVQQEDRSDGETRFRLLESVREFALEQLEAAGEAGATYQSHAAYFLALAEQADEALWRTASQKALLDQLALEHDNFHAALRWAIEHRQTVLGLRLGAALGPFWSLRGYHVEGRRALKQLLELPIPGPDRRERAMALGRAGTLAHEQGDKTMAHRLYQESLAIWRELGDRQRIARTLCALSRLGIETDTSETTRARLEENLLLLRRLDDWQSVATTLDSLGGLARGAGDYTTARARHEESLACRHRVGDWRGVARSLEQLGLVAREQHDLALARARYAECLAVRREAGDQRGVAWSLGSLASVARQEGDIASARAYYEHALATWRELGDRKNVAMTLACLGHVALDREDFETAHARYAECLVLRQELGNPGDLANSLSALAFLATALGDHERAIRLVGAALARLEQRGGPLSSGEQYQLERTITPAKEALSAESYVTALATGHAMPPAEAIEYALDTTTRVDDTTLGASASLSETIMVVADRVEEAPSPKRT